jgi:hypothetical protein
MNHLSAAMQGCIRDCLDCHSSCYGMAMTHCLDSGGEHVAPAHFRTMMACAEICATAARFMMMNSPHHGDICRECAVICRECAADCERLDGMQACVDACRRCADSCEQMAAAPRH